jgi:ADP-ribose pyrophosphatase YjhB (NUDIX family)
VVKSERVRVSVRSLCFDGERVLTQRPADEPDACYAFPGGGLELGDSFESRIREECREELGLELERVEFLFVVENRFRVSHGLVHSLELYVEVVPRSTAFQSREAHLVHHWLPIGELRDYDLRPHVVRDALASGAWRSAKHLQVPFP